nr:MAG TPA: hypothetical protein [Caudoviricetes sp.]
MVLHSLDLNQSTLVAYLVVHMRQLRLSRVSISN